MENDLIMSILEQTPTVGILLYMIYRLEKLFREQRDIFVDIFNKLADMLHKSIDDQDKPEKK